MAKHNPEPTSSQSVCSQFGPIRPTKTRFETTSTVANPKTLGGGGGTEDIYTCVESGNLRNRLPYRPRNPAS